jgi:predicted phosphoribosyltransferase
MSLFESRRDAGRVLASTLRHHAGATDATVLGLPRGGVPVAYEVASQLGLPLDIFVVRKLGVPGHEELAMGAMASGGIRVLNDDVVQGLGIPADVIEAVVSKEARELRRRERTYRGGKPPLELSGRTAILVDDGLATGSSMRAAVASLRARQRGPKRIVVAVPVASASACEELASEVDEIVCAATPEPFFGVGLWYSDFSQTTDEEVRALLAAAPGQPAAIAVEGPT